VMEDGLRTGITVSIGYLPGMKGPGDPIIGTQNHSVRKAVGLNGPSSSLTTDDASVMCSR
jgi:hypothetical protein